MGPQFIHDCGRCTFIGRATLPFNAQDPADVYTCEQGGAWQTNVFRYGDDGAEYHSYPSSSRRRLNYPNPAHFGDDGERAAEALVKWAEAV